MARDKKEPGLLRYLWCSLVGHRWMFVGMGTFVCRKSCGAVKQDERR